MSVHQMASYMRQVRSNPTPTIGKKFPRAKLKVAKKTVHNTGVLVNGTYISPDSLFSILTTKTSNQNYGSKYGGANKSVDQAIAIVQNLTGNSPNPKLISVKRAKEQSSTPTRSASSRATSSSTNRSASSGSSSTSASSGSSSGRTVRETAESVVPMQDLQERDLFGGGNVTNQQGQAVVSGSGLSTVALVGIGVGTTVLLGGILYIALSD